MKLKILATSDLHLGMRFSGYPEVMEKLSEARFRTLERLVEEANRRECGLFVVAGDLFHGVRVTRAEVSRAASVLAGFEGAAAAVLPGNHDFHVGRAGGLWAGFREQAGDRVRLLEQPGSYPLDHYGLEVQLHAGPCDARTSARHALSWMERGVQRDPGVLHIGVAHGSIAGITADPGGSYFPMKAEELAALGADLWIVGHTHLPHAGRIGPHSHLFVPGTPEPDGFDCRHGGQAWLIEVEEGEVRHEALPCGTYRFVREEVELFQEADLERLLDRYGEAAGGKRTLLDLTLRGTLERELWREIPTRLEALRERLLWMEVDPGGLAEKITAATVEEEFTAGSFPFRLLQRLLAEEDGEAVQEAYELIREVRG